MSLILVIEDDSTISETLEYNLKREGFTVVVAADGDEGLSAAGAHNPDLVLLDLMLPGIDGFAICERLRAGNAVLPILMITALSDEENMVKGFKSGADDYITKPFSVVEVISKVKAVLRRTHALKVRGLSNRIVVGDLDIDPPNYTVRVSSQPVTLRPKEFQLLALLAASPGKLFTREEIAQKVWGYTAVAGRTIDVHVKRVRSKIEGLSSYSYLKTVHGLGYRFESPEGPDAD
ncbi:MAG: response regulator transcription factor [Candidatus Aquicultorales bacterium]